MGLGRMLESWGARTARIRVGKINLSPFLKTRDSNYLRNS